MRTVGATTVLLAENDPVAATVLKDRFPDHEIWPDVRDLTSLPEQTDVLCAGFPCQNLSMAGDKSGIRGTKSNVVERMFRLIERSKPPIVLIENVYFMLHLDRGRAMDWLLGRFETLGYRWAYRVLDTIAFGLPQRRRRVYLAATRDLDPRSIVLSGSTTMRLERPTDLSKPVGFYWTEGRSGVGLTSDAVPPIKVGSAIGIASPPAVLFRDGFVGKPSIEACEALQGFPRRWTEAAAAISERLRWRLVGNAVSVPVVEWVANNIIRPRSYDPDDVWALDNGGPWPTAAYNVGGGRHAAKASEYPIDSARPSIDCFRDAGWTPLSLRATTGFTRRAREGGLKMPLGFLERLDAHAACVA